MSKRNIFDNHQVQYVCLVFGDRAYAILKDLLEATAQWCERNNIDTNWRELWRQNLPSIGLYNIIVTEALAQDLMSKAHDIDEACVDVYKQYCKINHGRDERGNVNVVEVTKPPLSNFFHRFLTSLSNHQYVINLQIFNSLPTFRACAQEAMTYALREVLNSRIRVIKTIVKTPKEKPFLLQAPEVPVGFEPAAAKMPETLETVSIMPGRLPEVAASQLSSSHTAATSVNDWIEHLDKSRKDAGRNERVEERVPKTRDRTGEEDRGPRRLSSKDATSMIDSRSRLGLEEPAADKHAAKHSPFNDVVQRNIKAMRVSASDSASQPSSAGIQFAAAQDERSQLKAAGKVRTITLPRGASAFEQPRKPMPTPRPKHDHDSDSSSHTSRSRDEAASSLASFRGAT